MLDNPVQRAIAAKRNVAESAVDDENNPRLQWRNTIVGGTRADIRFPLADPSMVVRHLKLAAEELHDIAVAATKISDAQNRLFLVRGRIKALSKRLNGTRWTRDI